MQRWTWNTDDEQMNTHTLTEFLFAAPAPRNTTAIIAWWERRRLAYNLWVGAAGLVSLTMVGTVLAITGSLANFPEFLMVAAVFGGLANICYFFGPATELLLEKLWGRRALPAGPMLYRMGLTFSVGLALFPTLLAVLFGVARVLLAILGFHWS